MRQGAPDADAMGAFGDTVDFGATAQDYVTHRAGFPDAFFERLIAMGWAQAGQSVCDLGCGAGTVARGLALRGLQVTGVDPSAPLLAQARALDAVESVTVAYREGMAEAPPLPDGSVDLVTAGQCWHWFDRPVAAAQARRILRPGGRLIIAHFDWLPSAGNVVAATEALILRHNQAWAMAGGAGVYPQWLTDMAEAGFTAIETLSFDVDQLYSHAAWRGRIRASAGVAASLDAEAVARFDAALAALLARDFPDDPLAAPHRVWIATAVAPG